jgi:hypothetical protein
MIGCGKQPIRFRRNAGRQARRGDTTALPSCPQHLGHRRFEALSAGQAAHLERHQTLGGKADHLAQQFIFGVTVISRLPCFL